MKPKRQKPPLSELHYYEILDRAAVGLNCLSATFSRHEAVQNDADLKKAYQKLEDAFSDFHQLAGTKYFKRKA